MNHKHTSSIFRPWREKQIVVRMKAYCKAFTLIELLVVVLIIGILTAVAVPQYKRAVRKAKYAKMLVLIEPVARAMDRYYLATGTYATSFDELDIEIPSDPITHCDTSWYKHDTRQVGEFCINLTTGPTPGVSVMPRYGDVRYDNGYQYLMTKYGRATPGMYCVQSRNTGYQDGFCKGTAVSADAYGTFYPLNEQ